jgi:uncharacterized C2H2 Zn-finger protein
MSWYTCRKCGFIAKQKEVMRRHLDKQKKCVIKSNDNTLNDMDLYNFSLEKNNYNNLLTNEIKENVCSKCNKYFTRKYSYIRHVKNNKCLDSNESVNEDDSNVIKNTINGNITNINNPIININFNMNNLKGFDEKWDVSKIDKYQMTGILLSNNKFSNTLEKILENNNNLNVIMNSESGIIYKSENDKYEPISKNDLFKQTMDKLYEHLKEFYEEVSADKDTSKYNGKDYFLNDEMKKININYERYYYKMKDFRIKADQALDFFYNKVKEDAQEKFIDKYEEKIKDIGF